MSSVKLRSRFGALLVVAVVVLPLAGWWMWREYFQTYGVAMVQPGVLYRAGVRSQREFYNACTSVMPRAVFFVQNAEHGRESFDDAEEYCRRLQIRRYRVRLHDGEPSAKGVQLLADVARQPKRTPVMVVAAKPRDADVLIAAYQVSALKLDKEIVKATMSRLDDDAERRASVARFVDSYQQQQMIEPDPADIDAEPAESAG